MSKSIRIDQAKGSISTPDADGFDLLAELALDLHSSWNHAADGIWRQLDAELWELSHNPWVVLQTVSRQKVQQNLADASFRKSVDELVRTRRDATEAATWFEQTHPQSPLTCVAYFWPAAGFVDAELG